MMDALFARASRTAHGVVRGDVCLLFPLSAVSPREIRAICGSSQDRLDLQARIKLTRYWRLVISYLHNMPLFAHEAIEYHQPIAPHIAS